MIAMLKERPSAMGFMGSDRFDELTDETRRSLTFSPVANTAIRFAIATCQKKVERVINTLARAAPITIATTYPQTARKAIAQFCNVPQANVTNMVETITFQGSLETKPQLIPRVDAIFDVVDSGVTLADNNLKIVLDDLGTITVGAVWRR